VHRNLETPQHPPTVNPETLPGVLSPGTLVQTGQPTPAKVRRLPQNQRHWDQSAGRTQGQEHVAALMMGSPPGTGLHSHQGGKPPVWLLALVAVGGVQSGDVRAVESWRTPWKTAN
jgi:hypothetical protein